MSDEMMTLELRHDEVEVDKELYIRRVMPYGGPGYHIIINDNFQFVPWGPDIPHPVGYGDLRQAKDIIDKVVALKAKAKATNFNKIILDSDGQPVTVVGLTRNDGELKILGNGRIGRYVYPNVGWIADLLKIRAKLAAEVNDIDSKLESFTIRSSGRAYRGMSADEYADRLTKFDIEVSAAEVRAEEEGQNQ